ncbi:MAG: HAMP domain-containing histidine kinase [Chloroflexota bacterium]|nr:HAMP domain-containing histidine kinase [Chloroflexota bacterium]
MSAPPRRAALPIRAKLTLLVAAALMVVLTLFGVVLYMNIRRVLFDSAAQSMRRSAAAAINEKLSGPNPPKAPKGSQSLPVPAIGQGAASPADTKPLTDLARFLTTHDIAARTTDTNGVTLGDGPALADVTTIGAPLLDAAVYRAIAMTNAERHLRIETPTGPMMVELIPLTRPTSSQTIGVLQLSTSLQDVNDLLNRLRSLLVIGTLLALLMTAALTVLTVRGVLRPLRRMAATSRAIAEGDLSRRVAVPPGGDELTDLARAFNQMVGRLDAAFATQRRFIADVSHELRSPLTSLGGGVEALMMGADRDDPAAHARLLRMMEREIARMGRLVDDLLTLTRFDADPARTLTRAPLDLVALVAQVADETRLLAGAQTVIFDAPVAEAIVVPGDADRVRQALLNLCANARAYTPPEGAITLGVRRVGANAVVTVADSGEGIAPDDLPRVWDRFYRADPARPRHAGQGGLGLGLAIVRAIIVAHGGDATIASTPGIGTTVTLTLPGATVVSASPLKRVS